ncbi:hypothetical protein A2763_03865 [Candidatus Kaiserbacteria bacterium RIFCSPHIGHO2_01_FULL_54_36]|uniref:Glycosyltransferase subfamily 4-like N-terminal domain-containing protein n=1 Tax=Candidatus Kaiserbacteria bacterium RIFCSPHIGHO2_01_FULL_54_36 TaxID=1798482 RepID=A0A1F6CJJ1_9BACT|nr:MAG: hypothetical protein A2763_03865 [Candidatus Kaiserbacteria bacterium RIFCSPHIGHO2_01_FULL_54_36]OGG75617.1 MAG: hypothetical protein A3A41_00675 [Candidatus Kaiserbacteria bacterium RIFCSPLOWO2_01_FULL_54_22]
MRILMIGKYPPIEGGVSSHIYWLARGLGEAGHEVSVVTNAGRVEEDYRISLDVSDPEYRPRNVSVFSLTDAPPRHIPFSEGYVTRLVALGLRAIEKNGADVIYAHYLEPYGVAGLLLKQLTGLPLVVCHAGSDIYKLFKHTDYSYVLGRILQSADIALMSHSLFDVANALGIPQKRLRAIPPRSRHPAFSPEGKGFEFPHGWAKKGVPIIVYLGKASKHKGLLELLSALAQSTNDFRLMFVSKGPLLKDIQERIARSAALRERVMLSDFIPPWRVPSLLRSSDLLVQLENRFPIPIHGPGQPAEAIACGTPLLLSEEMYKKLEHSFPRGRAQFSIVPDPQDIDELQRVLNGALFDLPHARKIAAPATEEMHATNDWDAYVATHVEILEDAIRSRSLLRMFRH